MIRRTPARVKKPADAGHWRQPFRSTMMLAMGKGPAILLLILFGMWGALIYAYVRTQTPHLSPVTHAIHTEMHIGADVMQRDAKLIGPGLAFALFIAAFMLTCLVAVVPGRAARWLIAAAGVPWLLAFVWMMRTFERYAAGDAAFLGPAPAPTTAMFVIGFAPLFLVVIYVVGFRKWFLTPEQEQHFDAILAEKTNAGEASGGKGGGH